MENCTIRYLNPGWQEPPKSESRSFRSRPFRAYKTHRKEVSDLDNCKLNFHVQFALSKKDPTKQKHAFDNYKDHVTDFKEVHGKTRNISKHICMMWHLSGASCCTLLYLVPVLIGKEYGNMVKTRLFMHFKYGNLQKFWTHTACVGFSSKLKDFLVQRHLFPQRNL